MTLSKMRSLIGGHPKTVALIATAVLAILIGGTALLLFDYPATTTLSTAAQNDSKPLEKELRPSLDCAFRPAKHNSVYFYFDVEVAEGAEPRFFERAIVLGDGSRTSYEGDDRPVWSYAIDADGNATITSQHDGTRILLYGLKMGAPGIWPIEAGIRSPVFYNLGGECRQANLVSAQSPAPSHERVPPAPQ